MRVKTRRGRVEIIDAKYELLKQGTYLMNHNATGSSVSRSNRAPRLISPKRATPSSSPTGWGRQYAADTYTKAAQLLATPSRHANGGRSGNDVQQPARQAAQTAEDARLVGLQRQDEEFAGASSAAFARARGGGARPRAREATNRPAATANVQAAERPPAQAERNV